MISILVLGQPDTWAAALVGAVGSLANNFLVVLIDGVVDQSAQLDINMPVFVLLGRGVGFSFLLLLTTLE